MNKASFPIYALCSMLCALFLVPMFAKADMFSRDLQLGDMGTDIQTLQTILNENPATQVAQSGPGSSGNETDYFGLKTQDAVKRFQELYYGDILVPAGLISGTGYVGTNTREKLESLSSSQSSVQTTQTNTTPKESIGSTSPLTQIEDQIAQDDGQSLSLVGPAIFPKPNPTPRLFFIDPYEATPSSVITLHGASFSSDSSNAVFIGDGDSIPNVASPDGSTLSVTLPNSLSLGKYEIWVTNSNGSSRSTDNPVRFIITNTPQSPPNVTSVSPQDPSTESTITITGENFSSTDNNIYSSAGSISNLPSPDGKTISFPLQALPFVSKIEEYPSVSSFVLWLTVQNMNGVDRAGYTIQVANLPS